MQSISKDCRTSKLHAITCDLWDNHPTKRVLALSGIDFSICYIVTHFIDPIREYRLESWSVLNPMFSEMYDGVWRTLTLEETKIRFNRQSPNMVNDIDYQVFLFNYGRPYHKDYETAEAFQAKFKEFGFINKEIPLAKFEELLQSNI